MNILNVNKLEKRLYNLRTWKHILRELSLNSVDVVDKLIEAYKSLIKIIVSPMFISSFSKMENYSSEIQILEDRL